MLKGGDHFGRVPLLFSAIFQFPLDLLLGHVIRADLGQFYYCHL